MIIKLIKNNKITLTENQIGSTLPKIASSLDKYLWLQNNLHKCDVSINRIYQRKFNGFYRVIYPDKKWRKLFYNLLQTKKDFKPSFSLILFIIYSKARLRNPKTKRIDASFASKLVATINPRLPIIDSIVLKNLGLELPAPYEKNRLKKIDHIYHKISKLYSKFLSSKKGKYLVTQFRNRYPDKKISKVKMLDFVLWQKRN